MTKSRSTYSSNKIAFHLVGIILISAVIMIVSNYDKNWEFEWKSISPMYRDSIIKIASENYVSIGRTSEIGKTSEQYYRRKWIKNNLNIKQLESLTEYPNNVVKLTAYEGLVENTNGQERIESIIKAIRLKRDSIYFLAGHLGDKKSLPDYLIQDFLKIDNRLPPFPKETFIDYGFTQTEIKILLEKYRE